MNQWRALIWKEVVETRWALYFSLLLMLLVLGIYQLQFGTMFILAPALALLLGVISSCRDRGEAEVFWRSRPIGTMRFIIVKYVCGLAVVLVSFGMVSSPMLVGNWTMAELNVNLVSVSEVATLAAVGPFVIAACYSLSFLTGSLVHRPHQAVILALAAVLMLLCVPMLIPPLRAMGIFHQIEARTISVVDDGDGIEVSPSYFMFTFGMCGLIVATAFTSAAAFRRNWYIAMDQKLMTWLLGVLAVLMVATAAYQVGSNIEPVREIALPGPPNQFVVAIAPGDDGRVLVITAIDRRSVWASMWLHVVDIDAALPIEFPAHQVGASLPLHATDLVWHERGGESVAYVLVRGDPDSTATTTLRVIDVSSREELHRMQLDTRSGAIRIIGIEQERLLLEYWDQIVAVDISRPREPVIDQRSTRQRIMREASADELRLVYARPDLPALRRRDDLMMDYIAGWFNGYGGEWPIYARMFDHELHVFKLAETRPEGLVFERVGTRAATPLERFTFERSYAHKGAISDRMFFTLSDGVSRNTMTVYDLHDPTRPRKFGHFVRPREWLTVLQPMPDGRMIAGGNKLYVFDINHPDR